LTSAFISLLALSSLKKFRSTTILARGADAGHPSEVVASDALFESNAPYPGINAAIRRATGKKQSAKARHTR
jgi:hypothetical protein